MSTFIEQLQQKSHDAYVNEAFDEWLRTWVDDHFNDVPGGKRLPYLGGCWPLLDVARGTIFIGRGFDGVIGVTSPAYEPGRRLTAQEVEIFLRHCNDAHAALQRGGNGAAHFEALREWLQTLSVE